MSNIPEDLRYTKQHEWIRCDGREAVMGITDFAQSQLGEIIYVELPEADRSCVAEESIATVESVKAASDIYTPITGKIIAVNEAAADDPSLVNTQPYGDGWLVKFQVDQPEQLDALLSPEAYAAIAKE